MSEIESALEVFATRIGVPPGKLKEKALAVLVALPEAMDLVALLEPHGKSLVDQVVATATWELEEFLVAEMKEHLRDGETATQTAIRLLKEKRA